MDDVRKNSTFSSQQTLSQNTRSNERLDRTSGMSKYLSPLSVKCQSKSKCDGDGMRRNPERPSDKFPIQKLTEETLPLSGSFSLPACKIRLSHYRQRVMSSPSIGPKHDSFGSLNRQPTRNSEQSMFEKLVVPPRRLENKQSLCRNSYSQLGLTPDTIPEFVIPTRKTYTPTYRNLNKSTIPGSNEFMCKTLCKPSSETFPATVSSFGSIPAFTSKPNVGRQLFDPGLPRGMTLKHIELSTTNYGFPMLSEPARWATEESIFHNSRSTLSGDQNATTGNHRERPRRASLPAMPTSTLGPFLSKSSSNQISRLKLRRTSSPALHMNLTRAPPHGSTSKKQTETESQGYRRSPYVYSCDKSIVIANIKQPVIEFSGTVNSATKTVNVTLHSVFLPGMDIERLETRVFVWMGKHEDKCRFSRQKTDWMTEDSTDRYLFGTEMNFRFDGDIDSYWLTFKAVTRRVENRDICHRAGKVMVSVAARGEAFSHITRILEATYQVG